MNIGYDAKRAFQNKTGLGNYTRSLITGLSLHYPQHQYTLFAPRQTGLFDTTPFANIRTVTPPGFFGNSFPGWWRRKGMTKDIVAANMDIFHGASNELPLGIQHTPVKTVVTVHDLIFERFPETYHLDERYVHRWKIKQACKVADAVIAASKQTRDDLIDFYKIPAGKISVCYQSCNKIFQQRVPDEKKTEVRKRYGLPGSYFLFVSSITKRKNLLAICKAMILLKDKMHIPLVVIGNGKKEKEEARQFMEANGLAERMLLLNELPGSKEDAFITGADFPAIYQQATALVYPSFFEGFGIPLLEAMNSGLPILCSNTSSLPEVAADAALYFPPDDHRLLAQQMLEIVTNTDLAVTLKEKGFLRSKNFTEKMASEAVMQVYLQVKSKK